MASTEILLDWEKQPSLKPQIEKVVVNLSVGKSGEPLQKAEKVLKELTGQTPCRRHAKKTIRDFGIRKGEPIACMVTLRKKNALNFLNKVLPVIENKLSRKCFDKYGNFAFGIKEHIDIAGVKYNPNVGIFGMDVCVTVGRQGYHIKRRRAKKAKINSKHILTPEESIVFIKDYLGIEIN